MKKGINKFLAIGIVFNSINIALNHIFEIPDFLHGFLTGVSIGIMFVGVILTVVGQERIKTFKKRLIGIK